MRRTAVAVAVVVAGALAASGCAGTVAGTAVPQGSGGAGGSSQYEALLTECDAVAPEQIVDAVGGATIARGFFGAICRWTVDGPAGPARVTFNWFETGALDVERETSQRLGYTVEDTVVEGRRAVLSRQPDDPGACGIAAGAPAAGVIGWWVQYRPGPHPDPCETAITLAKLTLKASA